MKNKIGYIKVNKDLLKQILEEAVEKIENYREEGKQLFREKAVKNYTKRWIFRDRTPEEAFEYAKKLDYSSWNYEWSDAINAYSSVYGDYKKLIQNILSDSRFPKTIEMDVSFVNEILRVNKELEQYSNDYEHGMTIDA